MVESSDSPELPEPSIDDDSYRDTLSSLAAAYDLDRAVMDECHPPPPETSDPAVCRYCQGPWQLWRLSRFAGHTRCVVTEPFQRRLAAFFDQNPEMTFWMVGQSLGVSTAVVKAWWDHVKNPRKVFRTSGAGKSPP